MVKNLLITALIILGIYVYNTWFRGGSVNNENFKDVTVEEGLELCKSNIDNEDFVVVDVRSPDEYRNGHLERALNINFFSPSFKSQMDKLDKSKTYFVYCLSGGRSHNAMSVMNRLGFEKVYNLCGGISDWNSRGCKVVK